MSANGARNTKRTDLTVCTHICTDPTGCTNDFLLPSEVIYIVKIEVKILHIVLVPFEPDDHC